jgi:hypothetical protein
MSPSLAFFRAESRAKGIKAAKLQSSIISFGPSPPPLSSFCVFCLSATFDYCSPKASNNTPQRGIITVRQNIHSVAQKQFPRAAHKIMAVCCFCFCCCFGVFIAGLFASQLRARSGNGQ